MAGDSLAREYNEVEGYESRHQQVLNAIGPERALWACVMYEAGQCLERKLPACTSNKQREEEMAKARRWFRSNSTDPGSYLWVCAALGVSPNLARQKYRQKLQWGA